MVAAAAGNSNEHTNNDKSSREGVLVNAVIVWQVIGVLVNAVIVRHMNQSIR